MSWATNNATARVFIVLKIDATFPGCLDSCDIGKPLMRFQWYLYML